MKSLERISFLTNVLAVACQRPSTEVGKLVKALVTYATDGTRTELNDIRLETFFDLRVPKAGLQETAMSLAVLRRKRTQQTQAFPSRKRMLMMRTNLQLKAYRPVPAMLTIPAISMPLTSHHPLSG